MTGQPGHTTRTRQIRPQDYVPGQTERRAVVGAFFGGFPQLFDLSPDDFPTIEELLDKQQRAALRRVDAA